MDAIFTCKKTELNPDRCLFEGITYLSGMKQVNQLLVTICLLTAACDANNKEAVKKPENREQDKQIITAISSARAQAFNEGNAAEIARYFSDDSFLMAPGTETLRGKEAVRGYYQAIFDQYETILDSGYEEVLVDGNLAYGRGFAKVTLIDKNTGDSTYSTSKYLNILEKREGIWITTHDIWNGNEP